MNDEYKEAEKYATMDLNLRKEMKDERGMAYAYKNLGTINNYLKNYALSEEYYLKGLEYAIKTEDEQSGVAPDGNRIIGEILDGHFSDGADAVASTPLVTYVGTEVKGKVVFTTVQIPFTSNASGEVAIWISAVTDVDAYVDNVKVYPAQ